MIVPSLPVEIWSHIVGFLDWQGDVHRFCMVSRLFYQIGQFYINDMECRGCHMLVEPFEPFILFCCSKNHECFMHESCFISRLITRARTKVAWGVPDAILAFFCPECIETYTHYMLLKKGYCEKLKIKCPLKSVYSCEEKIARQKYLDLMFKHPCFDDAKFVNG